MFWVFNGDSNLYPEIREKYFGFCSQFSHTPDSDYLDELPKSGENSVLWRKIFVLNIRSVLVADYCSCGIQQFLKKFSPVTASSLFRSKQSEDPRA